MERDDFPFSVFDSTWAIFIHVLVFVMLFMEITAFYKTQRACYYGKCIVSLSILVALRLMLNISVKFCQRKQAIVLTWVLHTIDHFFN